MMRRQETGSEIAARIAGGRQFWRVPAGDVQRWVVTLPPAATMELVSRTEWVGQTWDGTSDMEFGRIDLAHADTMTATEIGALLEKIRNGMARLPIGRHALPGPGDVRTCLTRSDEVSLVIDVDLGKFILPICVKSRSAFAGQPEPTVDAIADGMLGIIEAADAGRDAIARREMRLRNALEETAARIGDGAAPLWLRLEPIPHHGDPRHIRHLCYTMLLVTLDRNLVWVPSGSEDVRTVKDVRDHHGYVFRQHRSRSETLRRMTADGAEGYVSEVAMSLIEEHGLAASDVFRQARRAALDDRRGGVPLARGEVVETLYFDDGVLVASFPFEGGHFHKDTLSIWGDYPEALANAAKGRRIADFVDHPALINSGLTADRGETRQGALDIFTAARPLTLEEAQRRQDRTATPIV